MERKLEIVKAELLVLAKKFHTFCLANEIAYSIHGGTMLGAIREKGFIAWDDDMDITFTRNEYIMFETAYKSSPIEGVVLCNTGLYPRLLMKREGLPVVWLDIFIYDYITENPLLQKYKITKLKMYNLMYRDPGTLKFTKKNSKENPIRYMIISLLVRYGNKVDRTKLQRRAYKAMLAFPGDRKWLCRTNDTIIGMPKLVPGYAMDKYEIIQFEDIELMISSYWHEILISSYGENYMVPRKTTEEETHSSFISREVIAAEQEFDRLNG